MRQALKKVQQVVDVRNAVELAPKYQCGNVNLGRVDDGQLATHVDVGAIGHAVVKRQDGIGKGLNRDLVSAVRVVALEDGVDKLTIDRAALVGQELGQLLAALRQGGCAFAGPDKGVQGQTRHALGVLLRKERCAQGAR